MPTVQGTDAFDHGFDVPADYDAKFGTPTAVTTPLYQSKLNTLEINSPGNEGVRKNITGSPSRGWMGFPIRIPASPTTTSVVLAAMHSVTSNIQAKVQVNTSRVMGAYIGGGSVATGPTLAVDTWYWVELIYDASAATHALYWRVNGVDQSLATVAATGSDTVNYGQILSGSGDGTLTWYCGGKWSWGSAASSTDWLGEPSAPSGDLVMSLLFSAVTAGTVTAMAAGTFPNTNVFPKALAPIAATSTITASSTHNTSGAISLPLGWGVVTDGSYPPNNREGKALLASVATITVETGGAGDILGAALLDSTSEILVDGVQDADSAAVLASTASITVAGVVGSPIAAPDYVEADAWLPDLRLSVAFDTPPLSPFPAYEAVSSYLRGINSKRGRQFELDRVEAGQEGFLLSNLDGRFDPDNTAGPYYPNLKPTRKTRWTMRWASVEYDLFVGYLEGYPQQFPRFGYDAVVSQKAIDGFMPLAVTKLIPGSTTLNSSLAVITADEEAVIGVSATTLPMPQVVPFPITIDGEEMTVTEIVSNLDYRVTRTAVGSAAHSPGAEVRTTVVSFAQEYTGARIVNVLEHIGYNGPVDIDTGQTLLAPSDDIAGQAPLEHLQLVAEVEQGRLFTARNGTLTFHSRHNFYANEKTDRAVFGNGGGSELPYQDVEVTHDDQKIYNIVRITAADGTVYESRDQPSIDDHFERVYEKSWPLADANEAKDAAEYLLSRLSRMQVRIPSLQITGMASPTLMWPVVLALDLGQRFGFKLRPESGTQMIDKTLVVEGVAHTHSLSEMRTSVQFSLADTTHYWQLEVAGYSELSDTTKLAY